MNRQDNLIQKTQTNAISFQLEFKNAGETARSCDFEEYLSRVFLSNLKAISISYFRYKLIKVCDIKYLQQTLERKTGVIIGLG